MRKICARCAYWEAPQGKPVFCDVEGACRYRPEGDDGDHAYDCLTEACGYCEFYKEAEHAPEAAAVGDEY